MADTFWLKNPSNLFANGNYLVIWPRSDMTTNQILNTLTRIIIYLTILYLLFSCSYNCLYVPLIALILIVVVYLLISNRRSEQFSEQTNKNIQFKSEKENKNVVESESDQMPDLEDVGLTKEPNEDLSYSDILDQSDFAEWAYRSPMQTCKENTAFCSLYEDVRFTSS